jgi:hypothetical protein
MVTGVDFNFRLYAPDQATIFHSDKGAIMNSKFSLVRSIALTAALVAGVSGMARADDNDMTRLGGDGYRYFNSAPVDRTSSAWRHANPNGLSERQFEAQSSEELGLDFQRPTFDKSPSAWRQANPNGISEHDFQAMSSEAYAWHQSPSSPPRALASTSEAAVVAKITAK